MLLDDKARDSAWYCFAFDREDAVNLLEENAHRLGDGAFVVTSAGLNFATLTFLYKGTLYNIPVHNDSNGLFVYQVTALSTAGTAAAKTRRSLYP